MPEIITKYPDIMLQILRESGAECGTKGTVAEWHFDCNSGISASYPKKFFRLTFG